MYLKDKLIKLLNIKNNILLVIGAFCFIFGASDLLSLYLHYHDDFETIKRAKSTPESVRMIIIALIIFVIISYLKRKISNARFYSNFFESDLDGIVNYEDIASVTGKKIFFLKMEFAVFMPVYMKRYNIVSENGVKYIKLYSKTFKCSCRHCGAQIKKEEYFTGVCPYCRGSNLFAAVIADNDFYSITSEDAGMNKTAEYYQKVNATGKRITSIIITAVAAAFISIFMMMAVDKLFSAINYDEFISDYYHGVLFEGKPEMKPYQITQSGLINNSVFAFGSVLFFSVPVLFGIMMFRKSGLSLKLSKVLAEKKTPFATADSMREKLKIKKPFKRIERLIRSGYVKNCTFEKHESTVKLALSKKVQKDICPNCGAAITEAVDENYVCKHCNSMIMQVVVKK